MYSQTAKYHHVDVGKKGLSSGDQDIFFDTLFSDSAKTDQVGMDRVTCTYMPSKYLMCIDEFTITGRGKIVTSGTLHTNDAFLGTATRSSCREAPMSSKGHAEPRSSSSSTTRPSRTRSTCCPRYTAPRPSRETLSSLHVGTASRKARSGVAARRR